MGSYWEMPAELVHQWMSDHVEEILRWQRYLENNGGGMFYEGNDIENFFGSMLGDVRLAKRYRFLINGKIIDRAGENVLIIGNEGEATLANGKEFIVIKEGGKAYLERMREGRVSRERKKVVLVAAGSFEKNQENIENILIGDRKKSEETSTPATMPMQLGTWKALQQAIERQLIRQGLYRSEEVIVAPVFYEFPVRLNNHIGQEPVIEGPLEGLLNIYPDAHRVFRSMSHAGMVMGGRFGYTDIAPHEPWPYKYGLIVELTRYMGLLFFRWDRNQEIIPEFFFNQLLNHAKRALAEKIVTGREVRLAVIGYFSQEEDKLIRFLKETLKREALQLGIEFPDQDLNTLEFDWENPRLILSEKVIGELRKPLREQLENYSEKARPLNLKIYLAMEAYILQNYVIPTLVGYLEQSSPNVLASLREIAIKSHDATVARMAAQEIRSAFQKGIPGSAMALCVLSKENQELIGEGFLEQEGIPLLTERLKSAKLKEEIIQTLQWICLNLPLAVAIKAHQLIYSETQSGTKTALIALSVILSQRNALSLPEAESLLEEAVIKGNREILDFFFDRFNRLPNLIQPEKKSLIQSILSRKIFIYRSSVTIDNKVMGPEQLADYAIRRTKFRIPGMLEIFVNSINSMVAQDEIFTGAHYQYNPSQAALWSYESAGKMSLEEMLSRCSGHMAYHQVAGSPTLITEEAILIAGYLIPREILDGLNINNVVLQAIRSGKLRALGKTGYLHLSVNSAYSGRAEPFGFAYPVEILMENQAYMSDPFLAKDNWLVKGFSQNIEDPSHRIPTQVGIFLVPESKRSDIEKVFSKLEREFPGWQRPNKIFYYQGSLVEDAEKQIEAELQKKGKRQNNKITLSQKPVMIGQFKNPWAATLVNLYAIKKSAVTNGVNKYQPLPQLTRFNHSFSSDGKILASVQDLTAILEGIVTSEITNMGWTLRKTPLTPHAVDTGSSKRGSYQENPKTKGLPRDFDLMVFVDGAIPSVNSLSVFQESLMRALRERGFLEQVLGKGRQIRLERGRVDYQPDSGYALVNLRIFEGSEQNVPLTSIDVFVYNNETYNDGPRYQEQFLKNMDILLSKLDTKQREEGRQCVLSTIRTLKALFINEGVYRRYDGGLRGVGTEQLAMQLNGTSDNLGTPNPPTSLEELKRIFSVESAMNQIFNHGFENGKYIGLNEVKRKWKLWDIGASENHPKNFVDNLSQYGYELLLGLAADYKDLAQIESLQSTRVDGLNDIPNEPGEFSSDGFEEQNSDPAMLGLIEARQMRAAAFTAPDQLKEEQTINDFKIDKKPIVRSEINDEGLVQQIDIRKGRDLTPPREPASLNTSTGGIDISSTEDKIEFRGDVVQVPLQAPLFQLDLQQLETAPIAGFTFQILRMGPVPDLSELIGDLPAGKAGILEEGDMSKSQSSPQSHPPSVSFQQSSAAMKDPEYDLAGVR